MVRPVRIGIGGDTPDQSTKLNPCNIKLPLRITHGRSAPDVQPDAPTATWSWAVGHVPPGRPQPAIEAPAAVGDTVHIYHVDGPSETVTARLFTGRITDLQAVETGGLITEWLVSCVGDLARLGRIQVVIDRPAETDTARAAAILQSAGLPHRVEGAPLVTMAADTINKPALSALHEVCQSSGAILWQLVTGEVVYRAGAPVAPMPDLLLPCEAIGDGVDWTQSVTKIINHVTVTWREGVPPETTEHQWTMRDDPSVAEHGLWHADAATLCSTQMDASQLGSYILGRWRDLRWQVPDVVVYPELLNDPDSAHLALRQVGDVVLLPIDPNPNPTPGNLTAWVLEGWVEEWSTSKPTGHVRQLAVTDAGLRNILRTWDEVALETWDHWAQGSWLDLLIKEPTP
jgi:hypothetical protein